MYVVRIRRGSAQEWTEENPILLEGEVGYELDGRTFKVGDGVTPWTELSYAINEGPQGPVGPGITIKGVLPNSSSLPISPELYDYYLLENTGHGALWDGSQWVDTGPLQGPAGADGSDGADAPPNSLAIGTVTTGTAGSSAVANITGTPPSQTLNLTIPRGDVGATGAAGLWWSGTLAEYNDIPIKDPDTLYVVIG